MLTRGKNPKSTQKIKKNLNFFILIFLLFFLFIYFLSIFKFFISIYKMEPKSLKSISQKVIFLNINKTKKLKKDLPIKDYNRLKERTLSTVVREYKEKMKDKGEDYSFFLKFLKKHSYFYDDCWRYCIFCCAKERDKK